MCQPPIPMGYRKGGGAKKDLKLWTIKFQDWAHNPVATPKLHILKFSLKSSNSSVLMKRETSPEWSPLQLILHLCLRLSFSPNSFYMFTCLTTVSYHLKPWLHFISSNKGSILLGAFCQLYCVMSSYSRSYCGIHRYVRPWRTVPSFHPPAECSDRWSCAPWNPCGSSPADTWWASYSCSLISYERRKNWEKKKRRERKLRFYVQQETTRW